MKRRLIIGALFSTAILFAQTRVDVTRQTAAPGMTGVMVYVDGRPFVASLGNGVTVEVIEGVARIRSRTDEELRALIQTVIAETQPASKLRFGELIYRPVNPTVSFGVPQPYDSLWVYVNGILQTNPDDYTENGTVVQFSQESMPAAAAIVRLIWLTEQPPELAFLDKWLTTARGTYGRTN